MSMCFVSLFPSLHPQQSGVRRNGWYVCNALMQIDVFPLKLRNDAVTGFAFLEWSYWGKNKLQKHGCTQRLWM